MKKKTWTCVLGALAVSAVLGGSLVAQTEDGVVVIGKAPAPAPSPNANDQGGAIRLGSGSAPAPGLPDNVLTPLNGDQVPVSNSDPAPVVNGDQDSDEPDPHTIHPGGVENDSDPVAGFHGATSYGEFASGGAVGYAVSDDPRQILFRVGHRSGDIYGLNEGFTNLGAFVPFYTCADTALWFFNPRMVITDQGRGAANLGFGHRAYAHDLDRVFSFSTWYDYDTGHENDYHQVGVSFAMIGRNMTFRANGNWVVSEDELNVGQQPVGSPRLVEGMLVQDVLQFTEIAYNQADFEVSTPIPHLEQWGFEWGGGGYFLFGGDGQDAAGAKARIESQVTEDLWVNAILSNDRVYDTNVSVNFELTIPNAPPAKWFRRNKVRDSLLASDRRYYRVATDIVNRLGTVPVMMDGGNGGVQELRLAIINPNVTDDPTLAFGGLGTEADPFKSVLDYTEESEELKSDFAIVFVFQRDDNTDLNLDTTITLLDRQALLGEGIEHSLTNLGLASVALPGELNGAKPLLTNAAAPGSDVVTLANANQVSNFTIDAGGTASGIVGTGIDGFSINNVTMRNVTNGIQIVSDTTGSIGTNLGIIEDNMIAGVGLGSTLGVSVEHTAGTLNLLVQGNEISNFQGEDANFNGVLDLSEDTNMNGVLDPGEDLDFDGVLDLSEDLNMNGLLDRGFGLQVVASGDSLIRSSGALGELGLGIRENLFSANGTGSSVQAFDTSRIMLDFAMNSATGSTGADSAALGKLAGGATGDQFAAGFRFLADGGRIDISAFTDNSATGGSGTGGIFQTMNDGIITVSSPLTAFDNNIFNGNARDGMFVEANSGSILFDQISNSMFNNNGDDGLDLQTTAGGSLRVTQTLVGNTYSGNGDNGIELTGGLGGTLDVDIGDAALASSPITGNGGNGLFISTEGGTLMTSLSGITSTGNAGSGVVIHADGGDILIDGIAGNVFRLNGEHGLEIIADNGGRVITPFVGSAGVLLGDIADLPAGASFSNDFALNEGAGLFLGGSNDTVGATTGLIDLGSVTLNRFQRQGEDLDSDGNIDVMEDVNGNGVLDAGEDIDGDGHLDVAELVNGVIADGELNPSQGTEGILIDASDLRIAGTLTKNAFNGRRPVFNSENTGALLTPGSGRGIGGEVRGTSTAGGPGGLTLQIGTAVPEDANIFVDNGDAHIGLILRGNTVNSILVDNGTFSDAFDVPGTLDFGGEGIHYILRDTALLTGFVTNSTLSGNVGDGLSIEIAGNNDAGNSATQPAAALNGFMIVDNTISGNGSTVDQDGDGVPDPILSSGINIARTERGQFNDLLINWNTIADNTENGISIQSFGANHLNLANMRADTVMITDNTITGNLQDGIELSVGADADMAARLDGNVITMNGFGEASAAFVDVGNGIEVREFIQDAKDSRSLTGLWTNNIISDNFDDGVDISGFAGNVLVDDAEAGVYTVGLPAPGGQPVLGDLLTFGLVIGDTMLNPIGTIAATGNDIERNGSDGVDITGGGSTTIANNFIRENGTLDILGANTFSTPRHAGINIDGAELNEGIDITATGRDPRPVPNDDFDPTRDAFRDVFVFSNLITLNNGDGIEFLSEPSFDALDSASSGGMAGLAVGTRLTVAQNEITENAGRGIDILQRAGDADTVDRDNEDPDGVPQLLDTSFVSADVSIIGNHVKDNFEEGIYVVQSVDNVQNQISPSDRVIDGAGADIANGESLRAQGTIADIDDIVRLRLDIHDNNIVGNGQGVIDFPSTGLIVRVGTSGGTGVVGGYPAPIFDPNVGVINAANYFATDGFNAEDTNFDGILDNDLDGDGFLDAAPVSGSGVSASITGNDLEGNFGDELLFHSFTDTVQPTDTAGTWTPPTFDMMGMQTDPGEFTVNTFQADPLARFDLIFSNNEFNSVEANNIENTIGTSPGNAGIVQAGAYYDNNEATFKSREPILMMPGGGPFGPIGLGGQRQRNATRFASRWITGPAPLAPLPPFTPENGLFKYPGMGNSTFRVRGMGNEYTDQGLGIVGLDQIFIFDDPAAFGDPDLIDAFGEPMGVDPNAAPIGSIFELPWGWDVLEPGTPALPANFP